MTMDLIPIAVGGRLPTTYATSASWVHNCWTKHKVGRGGAISIAPVYVNGLISTNSESAQTYYDFILNGGLYIPKLDRFYPFTFNGGDANPLVSRAWGRAVADEIIVDLEPGDEFYLTNRRIAADLGAAGTYNVLASTGGQTFRADGIISGTDSTKDFTLGVGIAYGARLIETPEINDATGAISALRINPDYRGHNYTAGTSVAAYYGLAGVTGAAKDAPGSGLSCYGVSSGGVASSVTLLNGGVNHKSMFPPKVFLGGSGTAGSGFGSATAAFGPALIMGRPKYRVPGALIIGDSWNAYGSVDTLGGLHQQYGLMERKLGLRGIGCGNISVSGESATGFNTTSSRMKALYEYLQSQYNLKIDNVFVMLGVNDFNSNNNSDVIAFTQSNIGRIVDYSRRTLKAKAFIQTIPPYTTSSDAYVTTTNQTAGLVGGASTNYALAGRVEQYNNSVLNRTIDCDGVIDIGRALRGAGNSNHVFNPNFYGGTAASTSDGVHPNLTVGMSVNLRDIKLSQLYIG